MTTLLLTDTEIAELTGKQRHDAQARALRYLGIEHRVRPDGSIAVLRAHVEKVLGGSAGGGRMKHTEPNWGSLAAAEKTT